MWCARTLFSWCLLICWTRICGWLRTKANPLLHIPCRSVPTILYFILRRKITSSRTHTTTALWVVCPCQLSAWIMLTFVLVVNGENGYIRVTTCQENLEMCEILLCVQEVPGENSCRGKVVETFNCLLHICIRYLFSLRFCCGLHWFLCFCHYEVIVNLIVWSLRLALEVQARYEYRIK